MGKLKDLSGMVVNGIKVVSRDFEKEKEMRSRSKNNTGTYWKCICYCGNEFTTRVVSLKNGNTKSCGCLQRKKVSKTGKSNKKYNEWIIDGDTAIGITNNGERFVVDLEDLDKVKNICWYVIRDGYIGNSGKRDKHGKKRSILIHRIIMDAKVGEVIDHKNWDRKDNRKENLRKCTVSENNVNIKRRKDNTSGYTGVNKKGNKWVASISFNRKRTHLGTFETIEEAIIARKRAEEIIHKDFNGELNRQDFIKVFKGE